MTYEFDFSSLTVGDIRKFMSGNLAAADVIDFAEKVTVGGVLHLPASEFANVMAQLGPAYVEWIQECTKGRDNKAPDASAWEEMLQGIKGL
jgi:hypothetical protein